MKKVKPQNTTLLITLLICTIMATCVSKKNITQVSTIEEKNPKLIFLNYTISETINGKKKVEFINKIITDGKLKTNNYYNNEGVFGDLICNQLDKNSNVLQSIVLKNPLVKIIEYADESKNLHIKKVELARVEFSLKLKLEPNTKLISISEITSSLTKTKNLIATKIN